MSPIEAHAIEGLGVEDVESSHLDDAVDHQRVSTQSGHLRRMNFAVEGDRHLRPSEKSRRRGLDNEDRSLLDLPGPTAASSLMSQNDHEANLLVQEWPLRLVVAVTESDIFGMGLPSIFLLCILKKNLQ